MAKSFIVALLGLWALLLPLGGCQQAKSTVVQKLPVPSLDGPVVQVLAPVAKIGPTTKPATPNQAMAAAQKSRGERGGVPQEWLIKVPDNNWQYIDIHHSATPT